MLKLLLTRHAESVSNRDRRLPGRSPDPLTPTGIQQAQALGHWCHTQAWQPTHIYCSPAERSRQTVQHSVSSWALTPASQAALATWGRSPQPVIPLTLERSPAAPVPITLWSDLREIDQGIFSGLTWAEATTQYPDLCHRLLATEVWVPIPGAESPMESHRRAYRLVQQLITTHNNGDRVWLMSHGGFLNALISACLGCDRTWGLTIPNVARFEFWCDRDRWADSDRDRWNPTLWQIRQFGITVEA